MEKKIPSREKNTVAMVCGNAYSERRDNPQPYGWLRFVNPIFAVLYSKPIRYKHSYCANKPGHSGPHQARGLEWERDDSKDSNP